MKLDYVGNKMKLSIEGYLKSIDQYNEHEAAMLVDDTAYIYQLYANNMQEAEKNGSMHENFYKQNTLAGKQYIQFISNLKQLGVGVSQRAKLFIDKEEEDDTSIFTAIKKIQTA